MRKLDDLTGKRFGKLTVLFRSEDKVREDGKRFVMWHCKCDCGNEKDIYASSLRNGCAKSCGCLKSPDLTGKRFGMLTVEKKIEDYISPNGKHYTQWLCKCDCGNKKKALTNYLLSGRSNNCGCQTGIKIANGNTENLIGKRFGRLTVIRRQGYKEYKDKRRVNWICQCDCGNVTEATTQDLKGGNKRSCGCLKRMDIIGKKFGMLTVVKYLGMDEGGQSLWLCKCDCGNERICQRQYLVKSNNPSCGCINPLEKHGMSRSKIYHVWNGMKCRCSNENDKNYHNYGGRGIRVCDEWSNSTNGFDNFCSWAYENGYNENATKGECTIDRIDVNGNYEPSNCRWVTQKVQVNNERRNIRIEYKGKTLTAKQWSEELGLDYKTIRNRVKKGLPPEEILFKGKGGKRSV